jgi:DNA-binding PadR family transcriptional regulator
MNLQLNILRAIAALQPHAYGVPIRDFIKGRTGEDVSFGALYAAFETMEDNLLIGPREGEVRAERGGRNRIYFDLTPVGRRKLNALDGEAASVDRAASDEP